MPLTTKNSRVTGAPVPDYYIHADDAHFRDVHGRAVLLRGVNFSGAAKACAPMQKLEGFWEDADNASYVGNPLNLDDGTADVHLGRLRAWGFNCLRYVFTWEALEHEGPGKYDYEYMDYVVRVLRKCKEYGFRVFMDPHQDVWSRFSGGSGAPLWTLYACGMDPRNFTVTNAAFIQSEYPSPSEPKPSSLPHMIWSTNYTHLASQTLFTLFYAGKEFAPKCIIDGVNIEDYLRDHFFGAVEELAKKIAAAGDLHDECVIGWDSMNEPGDGMVGRADLDVIPKDQANKMGPSPTPFQGFRLGMGETLEVENWVFGSMGPQRAGTVTIDPKGAKAWATQDIEDKMAQRYGWKRDPGWKMGMCIWALHGVWDPKTRTLDKPAYFATNPGTGEPVDFIPDFWRRHWLDYATMVRKHQPEAIHFIQPPVFKIPPKLPETHLQGRACISPHFYDGLTLLTRHWNWFNADAVGLLRGKYSTVLQAVKVGESAIRASFQQQLGILRADREVVGNYPALIGEIGIPYDMDGKKAYGYVDGGKGEGDYSAQQKALDASLNACDGPNNLNYTMWTYVPDNSHQWGDNWNGEDLSIWSEDDTERAAKDTVYSERPQQVRLGNGRSSPASITKTKNGGSIISQTPTTMTTTSRLAGQITPQVIKAAEKIPPELIHDGSRAPAAFSRPYPIATVGTPGTIDFNISSSTFKYTVIVDAKDTASESVMTEIFLPFIHYASSQSPMRSLGKLLEGSVESFEPLRPNQDGKPVSDMEVDVEVKVSNGTYTIEGQTLRWWYKVPMSGSGKYTIEVKRKGGAIKRALSATSSWWDICPDDACCIQ